MLFVVVPMDRERTLVIDLRGPFASGTGVGSVLALLASAGEDALAHLGRDVSRVAGRTL
jgi:hypothetical protein